MELEEIFNRIDKLTAQSTLHGWYRGIDDEIRDIADAIDSDMALNISDKISKKLSSKESLTKNEYILIIVFLHKSRFSSFDLAEKLYLNLFEKIFDNDYHFLIKHIFDNRHPFPAVMTDNMIRRTYLSYKRAINEAFKINSLQLTITPADAVLYFTVLLCCKSLNDQNKAMVYFLLSRIDTKLPDELYKETMKYIYKLRSIIKAVEEDAESALSESLNIDEEVKNDPEEEIDADTKIVPQKEDLLSADAQESERQNAQATVDSSVEKDDAADGTEESSSTPVSTSDLILPPEPDRYDQESMIPESTPPSQNPAILVEERDNAMEQQGNEPPSESVPDRKTEEEKPNDFAGEMEQNKPLLPEESNATDENDPEKLQAASKGNVADHPSTYNVTFSKSLEEILELAEQFNKEKTAPLSEADSTSSAIMKKTGQSLSDWDVIKPDEDESSPEADVSVTNSDPQDDDKGSEAQEKTTFRKKSRVLKDRWSNGRINKKTGFILVLVLLLCAVGIVLFSTLRGSENRNDQVIPHETALDNTETPQDGGNEDGDNLLNTETDAAENPGNTKTVQKAEVEEAVLDEPVLEEPVLDEPVLDEPVLDEPVLDEPVLEEAVLEEAVLEEAVLEETVPEETVPEETVPEEAVPEETVPEEAVPEEAVPEEAVLEEVRPDQESLDYTASDGELFSFTKYDRTITWRVHNLNSFWNLFIFLSTDPVVDDALLQSIGDNTWQSYMDEMRRLNPEKEVLRDILEDDLYTIYRE